MEQNREEADILDQDEEEFEISNYDGNQDDADFDNIVGVLQEIVIGEEFENLQIKFFRKHYEIFEDNEENKMEYMTIFKEYQNIIEKYIEKQLKENLEEFDMESFLSLLPDRADQIDESLLDLLFSFSDFEQFKSLMLDYKKDFEEQDYIEKLKTAKQTAKKSLQDADKKIQQNQQKNIFSNQNQNKNLFGNNDPVAEMKKLALQDQKKKPTKKAETQQQQQQLNIQGEEELQKSFFIQCKPLATPQIQNKKQL